MSESRGLAAAVEAARRAGLDGGPSGPGVGAGAGTGATIPVTPEEDEMYACRSDDDVKWASTGNQDLLLRRPVAERDEMHDLRVKLSEARAFGQQMYDIVNQVVKAAGASWLDTPNWVRRR